MENFDNAIKLAKLSHQSLGLSTSLSNMLEIQDRFLQNMKGIAALSEIGYKYNSILNSKVLNQISKSLAYQSQFKIPQSAIDAIGLIQRQNEYMVGSVRTIAEALKFHLPDISEINNLHSAVTGISKQITQLALQAQNWELISDFEEITEQTLEFTEGIDEELNEEQKIKFQILLSAILSFFHKHKKHGVSALLIVDIFLRLAGIHQYCDFLKDKPLLAEKSEVKKVNVKQDSILYFIKEINKQVKEKNEHRSTARACEVKLKPTNKTITLRKLPINFEVLVLQINHKWVLISYLDPKDNLPETGWVLKKYLNTNK